MLVNEIHTNYARFSLPRSHHNTDILSGISIATSSLDNIYCVSVEWWLFFKRQRFHSRPTGLINDFSFEKEQVRALSSLFSMDGRSIE